MKPNSFSTPAELTAFLDFAKLVLPQNGSSPSALRKILTINQFAVLAQIPEGYAPSSIGAGKLSNTFNGRFKVQFCICC
jgi:hypothetical protein